MIRADLMRWLAFVLILFALPAFSAARFTTSGQNIIAPGGGTFIPNGYNVNYDFPGGVQNELQGDFALMIAQGANTIRIRIPFINVATCGDPYYPPDTSADAYNPSASATGYIDPTWWAKIKQQIDWAEADGAASGKVYMIDVAFVGGNCTADFSDSTFTTAYPAAEQWVAGQLAGYNNIVMELMAEPNAPTDQVLLNSLQNTLITSIRSQDAAMTVIWGPAPTYNARYATQCLSGVSNGFCTVDLYELNDYTKNIQTGGCVVGPPNTCPPYPGYFSDRPPGSVVPPCVYPLQGQPGAALGSYFVLFSGYWMSQGLGQCLLQARTNLNEPIWANQFGAYWGLPGANQWHADWIYFLHTNNIGGAKWVWRQAYTGSGSYTYGNGNALWWQAADGSWNLNATLYSTIGQLFNWSTVARGRRP